MDHLSAISAWLNPILLAIVGFCLVEGLHVLTSSINRILQQNKDEHAAIQARQAETEKSVLEHEMRIQSHDIRINKVESGMEQLRER